MTRKRKQRDYSIRKAPILVIATALVVWAAGVATGEPARVLEQACQICLSCIGLG
ncbi:MAG: CD1871A family CXXC motif-containing protein [Desulfobulbaceae bacterium]|jgi:hypothetical protein|nr:CD1871A family CXXC motif-containing protein [Desulfobulbaceae bacterium]